MFLQHARSVKQDCGKVVEREFLLEKTQVFLKLGGEWQSLPKTVGIRGFAVSRTWAANEKFELLGQIST